MLRVEDLDVSRTRPEAVSGNLAELAWLGLDWDEGPDLGGPHAPYRQSERLGLYRAALERLLADGRLIESYLTRREIVELAGAATGAPPGVDAAGEGEAGGCVYGPAHRLRDAEVAAARRGRRTPSLRFAVAPGGVAFDDLVAGQQRFDAERDVGDFVVRRADGLYAYQLAVVVDDAAMGITEVARGADLLASTAAQLLLYRALALPAPAFAHLGLLNDARGEKLAKRHGAASLRELELARVRPERVVGLLAHSLAWLPERREVSAPELLAGLRERALGVGADDALGPAPGADDAPDRAPGAARELPPAPAGPRRLSEDDLAWLGG